MSSGAASNSKLISDCVCCSTPDTLQPILETMVNKTNDIYNRWAEGQEVQTVLRHVVSDEEAGVCSGTGFVGPSQLGTQPQHQDQLSHDPFAYTHRSLAQCIVEVHQRAEALYPRRKPCSCSLNTVNPPCPPSHFWAPPPNMPQTSPVLPELYSAVVLQRNGLPHNGLAPLPGPQPQSPLSPASKLAVVDTLNFELGALNSSTDQSWMSFF